MSVQSEIDRLAGAKTTLGNYLQQNGVAVPAGASLDEMALQLADVIEKQNKITASGLLKGDGAGGVSAAVPGTDYLKVTQYSGTLLANSWAEDAYGYQAQTITITGLKASYDVDPQWDVALSGTDPDADAALLEGFALIHNYKTGANSLTAQCIGAAPTVNIPVKVVVFG